MRSFSIISFVLLSATFAFGCSAPSSSTNAPTGTVTGAVSSAELKTLSAVARYGTYFGTSGQPTRGLRILLSDNPNSCDITHFASATMLDVRVRGASVGPGTYPIVDAVAQTPQAGQAEADFNAVDAVCKDLVAQTGTSGNVILKTVEINLTTPSASHVSGSVDLTFAGGHITGDFDAVLCDDESGDAGASNGGSSTTTCAP